jgi:hypothetical protein
MNAAPVPTPSDRRLRSRRSGTMCTRHQHLPPRTTDSARARRSRSRRGRCLSGRQIDFLAGTRKACVAAASSSAPSRSRRAIADRHSTSVAHHTITVGSFSASVCRLRRRLGHQQRDDRRRVPKLHRLRVARQAARDVGGTLLQPRRRGSRTDRSARYDARSPMPSPHKARQATVIIGSRRADPLKSPPDVLGPRTAPANHQSRCRSTR